MIHPYDRAMGICDHDGVGSGFQSCLPVKFTCLIDSLSSLVRCIHCFFETRIELNSLLSPRHSALQSREPSRESQIAQSPQPGLLPNQSVTKQGDRALAFFILSLFDGLVQLFLLKLHETFPKQHDICVTLAAFSLTMTLSASSCFRSSISRWIARWLPSKYAFRVFCTSDSSLRLFL